MTERSGLVANDRIAWVDFLRCVSILLVIVIHVAAPLAHKWGEISLTEWMVGNFYNSFSRVSVPLLFMVSGFLLLGKQEGISDFYRKRFRKVFVPLLFWSVLYLVWTNGYRNFTWINAIKAIVYAMITAPASFHLWFLYELLAIYLFVPLIRVFVRGADDTYLWYFAGLWLLFGPVQEMFEHWLGFNFAINLGFFTSYIGFFVIGYLLGRIEFSTKMAGWSSVILFIGGIYTMYATYSLTSGASDFVQYYYWYTRINIVLMSFAAFILLKKIGENISAPWAINGLRRFAGDSFGVYLVHILVLTYLKWAGFGVFLGPALLIVPAVSLVTLFISGLIIEIIQRIPVLQEIAPK
jgi:surface polysaccharide O-acyltransferase-like enzyme